MTERDIKTGDTVAQTELRSGAIGLPSVLMQSITSVGPAIGVLFLFQFLATSAGIALPLALGASFILMLVTSVVLTQLAKVFPSAGGYFTYVSGSVNPRAGFLTAWIYFLYAPLVVAILPVYMGYILQGILQAEYNVTFPWWLFVIVSIAFLAIIAYRGIKVSAVTIVILGLFEALIMLALALSGLFSPGSGGVSVAPFNPASAPTPHGLYLGILGGILALTGWEGAAPLAEESRNPRRNVSLALVGSVVIMGIFFIFVNWGLIIGWGTHSLPSLVKSPENPGLILAKRLWGGFWIVVLLALINSVLAQLVSFMNVATRMWFAMARSGVLPAELKKVTPRLRVPVNAVHLQMLVMIVVAFGLGFAMGPSNAYFFLAIAYTLAIILIYCMGNLGVVLFYARHRRSEFNWFLHGVLPVAATIAFLWIGYTNIWPVPAYPVNWSPYLVGGWILLGIIVLIVLNRLGKEEWLLQAGKAANVVPADEPELRRASSSTSPSPSAEIPGGSASPSTG